MASINVRIDKALYKEIEELRRKISKDIGVKITFTQASQAANKLKNFGEVEIIQNKNKVRIIAR